MRCPSCQHEDTRVIDSRVMDEGTSIRRRRECPKCGFRFSTAEEIEILALTVTKVNGRQEAYDKDKLLRSIKLPLQKRPVTPAKLKRALHSIEQEIQTKVKKDVISTEQIGQIVMQHLKKLDKVAYIRFASVYRSFDDIDAFADELRKLAKNRKKSRKNKK
ncbi:MAG: transcriptional regulator NrdR [Candidatus Kerfeldbacteria bacterium RIFOXYA2_FULL_38_24]|uniref:Transcriptional repressor NrdR n=1 Tax=Candidatus Kerfeldbacteria bacterium RIFOXYB2_FULL_38_14 TaxID=1798547 RepID=A0A1G2BJ49_9BACT|nr:MAG: transcriptional regulator NrdR [Candidatus Kerfeldbacteria bacterium RIFOXYA2_FULL_38_24]OGY88257.1 MAG: transcriptional regulator NrdR [Candidatus Kerfeldbacteria bacterium RIFOXYB2_FULL_38_14]